MRSDLVNNLDFKRGLSPKAAGTDNTAYVSEICDFSGYGQAMFVLLTGTNTDADATFTVLFEDGDVANLSDNAAVADAQLIGTEALASFTFANDNAVRKIGYNGSKRYGRVTVTPALNAAGDHFVAGVWVLGSPRNRPTANPPA